MLRWSINLFKVFGIQLSVHASFFLLPAYAGYEGWQDSGLAGLLVNVAVTVLFFICVILHEFGHSLTAQRFGVRVPRILLLPIGGMAEFDRIPRQPSQELLITLAGPAVNFVIFALLAFAVGLPAGWWSLDTEYPATLTGLAQLLATWNLAMGCFNLLPVFPMDGGRIFRALLATRLPYLQATYWAVSVAKALALIAAALAVFYFELPLTALLFLFIIWAGHAEYRHTVRRDEEARYYAERARRLSMVAPDEDGETRPPLILHGPN
jgi:Zn-dependent protease